MSSHGGRLLKVSGGGADVGWGTSFIVSAFTAEEELKPSGGAGISYSSGSLFLNVTPDETRFRCVVCLCSLTIFEMRQSES